MKLLGNILVIIILFGCQQTHDNVMENSAVRFAGIFIRDKAPTSPSLRIKESKVVEPRTDSTYHVSGLVEGYSPMNYPVSIEHFTAVVRYSGGDPNAQKNWECVEIYVGHTKVK